MWFSSRRRHRRRPPSAPSWDAAAAAARPSRPAGLGDEIEALMAGRLVDHLMASKRAVPPWAALNRLAHADRHELLDILSETAESHGGWELPWAVSERVLAFHILSSTQDDHDVRGIQQVVLIPLEWSLIEQNKTARLTVCDIYQTATRALNRHLTDR